MSNVDLQSKSVLDSSVLQAPTDSEPHLYEFQGSSDSRLDDEDVHVHGGSTGSRVPDEDEVGEETFGPFVEATGTDTGPLVDLNAKQELNAQEHQDPLQSVRSSSSTALPAAPTSNADPLGLSSPSSVQPLDLDNPHLPGRLKSPMTPISGTLPPTPTTARPSKNNHLIDEIMKYERDPLSLFGGSGSTASGDGDRATTPTATATSATQSYATTTERNRTAHNTDVPPTLDIFDPLTFTTPSRPTSRPSASNPFASTSSSSAHTNASASASNNSISTSANTTTATTTKRRTPVPIEPTTPAHAPNLEHNLGLVDQEYFAGREPAEAVPVVDVARDGSGRSTPGTAAVAAARSNSREGPSAAPFAHPLSSDHDHDHVHTTTTTTTTGSMTRSHRRQPSSSSSIFTPGSPSLTYIQSHGYGGVAAPPVVSSGDHEDEYGSYFGDEGGFRRRDFRGVDLPPVDSPEDGYGYVHEGDEYGRGRLERRTSNSAVGTLSGLGSWVGSFLWSGSSNSGSSGSTSGSTQDSQVQGHSRLVASPSPIGTPQPQQRQSPSQSQTSPHDDSSNPSTASSTSNTNTTTTGTTNVHGVHGRPGRPLPRARPSLESVWEVAKAHRERRGVSRSRERDEIQEVEIRHDTPFGPPSSSIMIPGFSSPSVGFGSIGSAGVGSAGGGGGYSHGMVYSGSISSGGGSGAAHANPFSAHAFTPISGAPGFRPEEYDWDKGFSDELEGELRGRAREGRSAPTPTRAGAANGDGAGGGERGRGARFVGGRVVHPSEPSGLPPSSLGSATYLQSQNQNQSSQHQSPSSQNQSQSSQPQPQNQSLRQTKPTQNQPRPQPRMQVQTQAQLRPHSQPRADPSDSGGFGSSFFGLRKTSALLEKNGGGQVHVRASTLPSNSAGSGIGSGLGTGTSTQESTAKALGDLIEKKIGRVVLEGRKETTEPVLGTRLADLIRPHLPPLSRLPKKWTLLYSLDQHGISLNTLYTNCEAPERKFRASGSGLGGVSRVGVKGWIGSGGVVVVVRDAAGLADLSSSSSRGSGGDERERERAGEEEQEQEQEQEQGEVFGAFVAEGIGRGKSKGFFGGGDSFLWKYRKGRLEVFKATGQNTYFCICENEYVGFGGGSTSYGLYLAAGLLEGSSAPSLTFGNEVLCSSLTGDGTKPKAGPGGEVEFECVGLEVWGVGP